MENVRVRFAPSPTGPLHIGGVRTALYNYLFARKHNGTFILRIEDTDQTRYVPGAEEYIIESLKWCGLTFDEGPGVGGPFGPYRQSDRKEFYRDYVETLIQNEGAYYAFDTPEELEEMRKRLSDRGVATPQYDSISRKEMKNSLTLSPEEVYDRVCSGQPYVVRALIPENEEVVVNDLIRGEVRVNTSRLDDKVLFKSDGMPTYHLANIVDDHLMEITHVIRGEEWLPSAPLHVLLYKFFGWKAPQFAHLPLLLKPDGNGKLSKRDGDRLGFPVFPLKWTDPVSGEISSGYRESGYLPEAFVNMLALLGWNPGTEQEIFSLEELIQAFDLERVGKSGSKFDPEKAKWFNHQYITNATGEELAYYLQPVLQEKGINRDAAYIARAIDLVKERVTFLTDLWDQSFFLFTGPESYDEKVVGKFWKSETPEILGQIKDLLHGIDEFTPAVIDNAVKTFIHDSQLNMGQVMNTLRLVIVGKSMGPGVAEMIAMIGKDEITRRIERAVSRIGA